MRKAGRALLLSVVGRFGHDDGRHDVGDEAAAPPDGQGHGGEGCDREGRVCLFSAFLLLSSHDVQRQYCAAADERQCKPQPWIAVVARLRGHRSGWFAVIRVGFSAYAAYAVLEAVTSRRNYRVVFCFSTILAVE